MGYIAKGSLLKAYLRLSHLSDNPTAQGATQRISALRYFVALDQFYFEHGRDCDTKINSDKDLFSSYVGNVVSVTKDLYTSNFYYPLQKSSGDFNCGSNFYSVNVVKISRANPYTLNYFPRRGNYPLMEVKDGVLIKNSSYYKNISFYLNDNSENCAAFVVWLIRNEYIDKENFAGIKKALFKRHTKEFVDILMPDDEEIYYNQYLSFNSDIAVLNKSDIKAAVNVKSSMPCNINYRFRTYITAIKSKPFLLLAGISGTGKSRIVRELARACWEEDTEEFKAQKPKNFEMIQVKSNWHDSSELIGYVSRINGERYVVGPFLRFLVKAIQNPQTPHFLCLDEMNLAPVEQYFAEYLSVIESRKVNADGMVVTDPIVDFEQTDAYKSLIDQLFTDDEERKAYLTEENGKRLSLPANLIVIGTVNMDETTFSFSRKVLDRAMTIEMNEVDLDAGLTERYEHIGKLGYEELIGTAVEGVDVYSDNQEVCDKALIYLKVVNAVLEGTPFKVAYRTRNEFLLYVVNNLPYNKDEEGNKLTEEYVIARALDEVTNMKILSRIEGDDTKVTDGLLDNLKQVITEALANLSDGFPIEKSVSLKKLDEMKQRLVSGYTSFWS